MEELYFMMNKNNDGWGGEVGFYFNILIYYKKILTVGLYHTLL